MKTLQQYHDAEYAEARLEQPLREKSEFYADLVEALTPEFLDSLPLERLEARRDEMKYEIKDITRLTRDYTQLAGKSSPLSPGLWANSTNIAKLIDDAILKHCIHQA